MSKNNNLEKSQQEIAQQVISVIRQEFSGPLPPPHVLEQYKHVLPDAPERIIAMAEEQGRHRRKLETKALNTDSRNSLLGIISGFLIGLSAILVAGFVIYNGQSWPGTILGSAGLVGLVAVFVYGTNQRRSEREKKSKQQ